MTRRKLPEARPNHMTPAERDEAIRLYASGTTRAALAERYGRGVRTIDRLILRRDAKRGRIWADRETLLHDG